MNLKEVFKKQDKEFEEMFVMKSEDRLFTVKPHLIKNFISKIRQETLQAVREEIEKKKYPSEEKFSGESEYTEYTTANPSDPTEALMQHAYNQALDDLLKSLDI